VITILYLPTVLWFPTPRRGDEAEAVFGNTEGGMCKGLALEPASKLESLTQGGGKARGNFKTNVRERGRGGMWCVSRGALRAASSYRVQVINSQGGLKALGVWKPWGNSAPQERLNKK